ncbi:MAG TPA: LPS assembly lipoprotein LptE [Thermoanaerobaculia bacterium]|nr:LPS assembly lipoprotein LptE [Thermoanaerobaculia bacterium]
MTAAGRDGETDRITVVVIAAVLTLAAGCGYRLAGTSSTLPATIRVIRFQTLANQTSRVGVEQRLSSEIAKELASRGRFAVQAGAAGADADLSGAVIGFDLYPVAFDADGRAREYQIRITARVSFKTLPGETVLWENLAFAFQDNYTFSTSAASYVDRENEAIDRVAGRFAESLVSNLLEGF